MKSSDNFEPIYLQDAKRHIDWLYEKINQIDKKDINGMKTKKVPFLIKFINFLKRVF